MKRLLALILILLILPISCKVLHSQAGAVLIRTWTAPYDPVVVGDTTGSRVAAYDLRFSDSELTPANANSGFPMKPKRDITPEDIRFLLDQIETAQPGFGRNLLFFAAIFSTVWFISNVVAGPVPDPERTFFD